MSDLFDQWSRQQSHSRPVSGDELEAFGKKAADYWMAGQCRTLNEAVVETVKTAGLSPEQVRRVVEFTNTHAYLAEFRKEGSGHKVINFPGGPASPAEVLKDLNDGGGGTVFDTGGLDYSRPPERSKTASIDHDRILTEGLGPVTSPVPVGDPLQEVYELKDKLASLYENKTSELQGLEVMYMDLSSRLYEQVKQAALSGASLGEVLRVWQPVTPDAEYVKVAFAAIAPRLLAEGVFPSADSLEASFEKTGAARLPNMDHPLVPTFQEYCQTLYKLAETRVARDEAGAALDSLTAFITAFDQEKVAGPVRAVENYFVRRAASRAAAEAPKSPGLIRGITDMASELSVPAGELGRGVGQLLFGEGSSAARSIGGITSGAVKYAPHLAALYGAHQLSKTEPVQRLLGNRPAQPPYGLYGY